MRALLTIGLLMTSSCTRSETVPTTITQTVPVAVIQPCLKPGQKPDQPKRLTEDLPVPPPSLTEMVGRLRAKLKEWQDIYGPTADDLLKVCSEVQPL